MKKPGREPAPGLRLCRRGKNGQCEGAARDRRAGCDLKCPGRRGVRHGTMVRSMAAAAGRQARIVAGIESGRKRPQPEEQNEEDGERAPHLGSILHE